ncbi:imidazole glycerol phosphate synthase subunit HisF [soil metagenome]
MLTKRIIPCLDIREGRTVKGINFENIRDAGDPVEFAKLYADGGADELVFLDITATTERRSLLAELIKNVAKEINIPFTVGGGISSLKDVEIILNAGADKITINSAAVRNPILVDELSHAFGSQCIIVAMDIKNINNEWKVFINGGRTETERNATTWAKELTERGAGEILLTSMDHDGTKAGFALDITKTISELVSIPVIASGGAGIMQHFTDVFTAGKADAALAASIFHFKEIGINQLKQHLKQNNIAVRI